MKKVAKLTKLVMLLVMLYINMSFIVLRLKVTDAIGVVKTANVQYQLRYENPPPPPPPTGCGLPEAVSAKTATTIIVKNIYPNPSKSNTKVELFFEKAEFANIFITDMMGVVIKPIFQGNVNKGERTILIDTKNLKQGVYRLIVKTKTKIEYHQLVLLK